MKTVSIIMTREEVKRGTNYLKFWVVLFILAVILSIFTESPQNLFPLIVGFFLALITWYSNHRYSKIKGNIVSKSVIDINSLKNSLLLIKLLITFYLIFFGFITIIFMIGDFKNSIGLLLLLLFILFVFFRRKKLLSKYIKKKK
jgi:hypothetical protein